MRQARTVRVRGVVQGVGFRPFVYRRARAHGLTGWVLNAGEGVEIHAEGLPAALDALLRDLETDPPPASRVSAVEVAAAALEGHDAFTIRHSTATNTGTGTGQDAAAPTVRISPDLPVCADCLAELADPGDRRHGYPYINCTACGPRYSIVLGLPYDRPLTTMREWPLCADCAGEYADPGDRRFHAQPVACPACGPAYRLEVPGDQGASGEVLAREGRAVELAADRLRRGEILAIKGLGGYHLACDAENAATVAALRTRKYRKEKPFALLVPDLDSAMRLVEVSTETEALLTSTARPIVLAPARRRLPGVAPGNPDLGVMLPYTPLHPLLFKAGAPQILVLTSANRSSEPIAYRDDDARQRLAGIADAFLVGERPIARRVDDSVARADPFGPSVLRRGRGLAPGAVARLPDEGPVLAVGGDLKNTVTLVVGGEAFVSQHIGDLSRYEALSAFRETVDDLCRMYRIDRSDLLVAHDAHPGYASTQFAVKLEAREHRAVQHHRAHVASVLAERGEPDERVVGVAFDGTGYGDDGTIWGGELFVGSLRDGFVRAAHLRPALLPGGDAAARHPVQAAAGFLADLDDLPDLEAPPFRFPQRYGQARALAEADLRTFRTTSVGRLFDTAAALLGFTREIAFEGQAAIWLEHLARSTGSDGTSGFDARRSAALPFPFAGGEIDPRPALRELIDRRLRGEAPALLARAFQRGLAEGLWHTVVHLADEHGLKTAVLSGGVFQNQLLLADLSELALGTGIEAGIKFLLPQAVPANDGGLSLGQAALAVYGPA